MGKPTIQSGWLDTNLELKISWIIRHLKKKKIKRCHNITTVVIQSQEMCEMQQLQCISTSHSIIHYLSVAMLEGYEDDIPIGCKSPTPWTADPGSAAESTGM